MKELNPNEEIPEVDIQTHWVNITLQTNHNDDFEEVLSWKLPWRLRLKYDWYFKYRAALMQVQNPKKIVTVTWGNYVDISDEEKEKVSLHNRIGAKKRKITEFQNKVKIVEKEWDELFPISDNVIYRKVIKKIDRKKEELKELILQRDEKPQSNREEQKN
jgi:hypothetical protein